jgi:methyltransferase
MTGVLFPVAIAALAFIPMLVEARRSSRNERALRAAGAVEPAGDVYRVMQIAYPACFLAMVLEAGIRGRAMDAAALPGTVVYLAAKALKYWAIATLGERWTFRVLVPPGAPRVVRGPYKFARHPNYIAVAGELVGFALLAQAPLAGTAGTALFGTLMLARIRVEEHALDRGTR